MIRRTALALGLLAVAAAGCATLSFSTPTPVPSYQSPAWLAPAGYSNPTASAAPASPAASPAAK